MSHAHQPHSLPSTSTSAFAFQIGALGKGKSCPSDLRCPDQLVLPFSAMYYDLKDPAMGYSGRKGAYQTPWTGTVDLETHYLDTYSSHSHSAHDTPPPEYPGYRVAPVGQLQILVKTASDPVKVFIIPYDLRQLPVGGRLLARERTVVETHSSELPSPDPGSSSSSKPKESLRYAIQLQFTCIEEVSGRSPRNPQPRIAATTRRSSVSSEDLDPIFSPTSNGSPSTPTKLGKSFTSSESEKSYFLSKSIKVIFTSSPPSQDEITRTERRDEVVPSSDPSGTRGRVVGFSPGSSGRAGEWETIRRKWQARQFMQEVKLSAAVSPDMAKSEIPFPRQPISIPTPVKSPIPAHVPLPLTDPSSLVAGPPLATVHSQAPSRSTTPTPLQRAVSPSPPSIKTPTAQRYAKGRLRRGSGSVEERGLSEKLRALSVKAGQG